MENFVAEESPECHAVEDTLGRISKQAGVQAVIVYDKDDLPVHTTVDGSMTMSLGNYCRPLEQLSRNTIRDIDPTNDLVLIRMKTKRNEIIMAPEGEYLLVVIQNLMNGNSV